MNVKHKVVLSVGSNDVFASIIVATAIARLGRILTEFGHSGAYITRPLSGEGRDYVNAVLKGNYSGNPEDLVKECKRMERKFGRNEEARMQRLVPLDVDVVIIDDNVVRPKDYDYSYFQTGLARLK